VKYINNELRKRELRHTRPPSAHVEGASQRSHSGNVLQLSQGGRMRPGMQPRSVHCADTRCIQRFVHVRVRHERAGPERGEEHRIQHGPPPRNFNLNKFLIRMKLFKSAETSNCMPESVHFVCLYSF
jgi:hypothetical protein